MIAANYKRLFFLFWVCALPFFMVAQDHDHDHDGHDHDHDDVHATMDETHTDYGDYGDEHGTCGSHEEEYNAAGDAFHHIADANAYHVFGEVYLPLPMMLYAPDAGWNFMLASAFDYNLNHGNGRLAIDRYVLNHGEVMRIKDTSFPMGEEEIECIYHGDEDTYFALYKGQGYELEYKSTLDGGLFGGGLTSFYDFSITKNVFTMLLVLLLMFFVFRAAASGYQKREGQAPKGIQAVVEPVFVFIRDEVAIPFLGHKYEQFFPFLLSIFFFILGLNLIGQIPFFPGSANVTGSLAVTGALAIITFILVNINGNKHYWQHIFWMPGVPIPARILLAFIEFLSLFIKPLTLMLRLAANITAGHIVVFMFIALIFIFGKAGENLLGAGMGTIIAIPLTMFMMAIELVVAFVQAFVFTILAASYLGAAVEEAHH
jgi:F-type H+-transporting ATPase subunit a